MAMLSHRVLGPARMRLLPKRDALRPIVNLSCATSVTIKPKHFEGQPPPHALTFPAVNKLLQPVHSALKGTVAASAELQQSMHRSVASVVSAFVKVKELSLIHI